MENQGQTTTIVVDLDSDIGSGGVGVLPPADGFPVGSIGFASGTLTSKVTKLSFVYSKESGLFFAILPGTIGPAAVVQSEASGRPFLFGARLPTLAAVPVPGGQNWAILTVSSSPTPPVMPVAPGPFPGTLRTVDGIGIAPLTYVTLGAAVAASAPLDRIVILAGVTSTELATVVIPHSLEIQGLNRATSTVVGNFVGPTIQIPPGVNDVYIHTMTVTQLNTTSNLCSAINAQTVDNVFTLGSSGLYFQDLSIRARRGGVTDGGGIIIGANGWVIDDCDFAAVVGANSHIFIQNFNTRGDCFINNCVFVGDAAPGLTRCIQLYRVSYSGIAQTGHTGNLVVSNCSQLAGSIISLYQQEWFKQPGLNANPVVPGSFALWAFNNTCNTTINGAFSFQDAQVDPPLSFFSSLYLSNNTCGAGNGLGLAAFRSNSGLGRVLGIPASAGIYAPVPNTIGDPVTNPLWTNAAALVNLLGIRSTDFITPAPLIPVLAGVGNAPPEVVAITNEPGTEGAVVALSPDSGPAFDAHEMTENPGPDGMSPLDLALVRSSTTGQPLLSGGRRIFALLQAEHTSVDGQPFNDTTARGKLSFVRGNATQTDFEACPVADIQGQSIQYQYVRRLQFTKLPQYAFVDTGF